TDEAHMPLPQDYTGSDKCNTVFEIGDEAVQLHGGSHQNLFSVSQQAGETINVDNFNPKQDIIYFNDFRLPSVRKQLPDGYVPFNISLNQDDAITAGKKQLNEHSFSIAIPLKDGGFRDVLHVSSSEPISHKRINLASNFYTMPNQLCAILDASKTLETKPTTSKDEYIFDELPNWTLWMMGISAGFTSLAICNSALTLGQRKLAERGTIRTQDQDVKLDIKVEEIEAEDFGRNRTELAGDGDLAIDIDSEPSTLHIHSPKTQHKIDMAEVPKTVAMAKRALAARELL
ncbi:MAG: hypothetical protein ACI9BD_000240, partial [Candidatus Marinamargulisbacteria bacterium]